MAGFPLPIPGRRRRPSVRTPPFVPSSRQAPSPPPVPPTEEEVRSGAQQPTPPPGQQPGLGRRVFDFLSSPDMGTYFAGVSNRLLAPRQFGETATSQIMGGLLGGYNDVAARRMMMYQSEMQQQEARRKAGLEERELTVKEKEQAAKERTEGIRAGAEATRAGAAVTQAGAATTRAQTDIARQKAEEKAKTEELAAQKEHWKALQKQAEDNLKNQENRTANYERRTEVLGRREENRAAAEANRQRVAEGQLGVARAKAHLEGIKEIRQAAEAGDTQKMKRLELAYGQAAKEMQSAANVAAVGGNAEAFTRQFQGRVQQILQEMDKAMAPQADTKNPPNSPVGTTLLFNDGVKRVRTQTGWEPVK